MYKWILCQKYLRTRYIALASIVSVTLGVATMIIVNAVMAGFSTTMRERLHGTLSDLIVESYSLNGFGNPDEVMAAIEEVAGDRVEAMAPSLQLFGLLSMPTFAGSHQREVQIIGIRPEEHAKVADFARYLVHQPRGEQVEPPPAEPTFEVPERALFEQSPAGEILAGMSEDDPDYDAFRGLASQAVSDYGAILGYALGTYHRPETGEDVFIAPEGRKLIVQFASADLTPEAISEEFTVVSYFKSDMSEYDSVRMYVPLERLQQLRYHGHDFVNQVQVKAAPGADLDEVAAAIRTKLAEKWPRDFLVSTWEQKQGPLLAAVQVEQNILNILLFFIIAVAGFGILGIFSMIVVEKTRDIGTLKALGASDSGIRGIFLGYGLSLGAVGGLVGMAGGLLFVRYINEVEDLLSVLTGREVFDDAIYYFPEIPTLVEPWTVAWIVFGAMSIAVGASVWPALRAARMHPVDALRYE